MSETISTKEALKLIKLHTENIKKGRGAILFMVSYNGDGTILQTFCKPNFLKNRGNANVLLDVFIDFIKEKYGLIVDYEKTFGGKLPPQGEGENIESGKN